LGEKFLKTQDEYEKMKGGKRKRKTRNKRKRRKNRTRKVQRGGWEYTGPSFSRFQVNSIICTVGAFLIGRYVFPAGGHDCVPFDDVMQHFSI